jgi:hypothetical protein
VLGINCDTAKSKLVSGQLFDDGFLPDMTQLGPMDRFARMQFNSLYDAIIDLP